MFTLIAIGIGAAFVYSLVAVFAPQIFPAEMRDHHGLVGDLFRGGGGDHRAGPPRPGAGAARARADQRRDPRPPRPRAEDGAARSRRTATRPRCRSPRSWSATCSASARATRCRSTASSSTGRSAIEEALITGEPIPVEKRKGDRVTGGTQNTTGSFDMKVDRTGAETTLSRIVALVAEAQRSRAPIQGLADRVSAIFVPAVIVVAVVAFVFWLDLRAVAGARLRAGRGGERADHRLPLRARPRHADLDHGRDRPRRAGRPPHPQCRGAGADGLGRYARRRQDRDADRGQAEAHRHRDRARLPRGRAPRHGRRDRAGQRAPARRGDRCGGEGARPPARQGGELRRRHRPGRARQGGGARGAPRQSPPARLARRPGKGRWPRPPTGGARWARR